MVWTRHIIDYGGRMGGGMQTDVKDMDGDGDLDVVSGGKAGLFVAENLTKSPRRARRDASQGSGTRRVPGLGCQDPGRECRDRVPGVGAEHLHACFSWSASRPPPTTADPGFPHHPRPSASPHLGTRHPGTLAPRHPWHLGPLAPLALWPPGDTPKRELKADS